MTDHEDAGSDAPPAADDSEVQAVLEELTAGRDALCQAFRVPFQVPEPSLVLDLASRADSEVRGFKHIHQTSLMHQMGFVAAQRIKLLMLLDAYLLGAASRNPMGIYLAARSLLELNAFLHEVKFRLGKAVVKAEHDWRGGGSEFFNILVRARYATTRPDYLHMLRDAGVPRDRLQPMNVMNCLKELAQTQDFSDARTRYDFLSDYVHHNLGAATAANAGSDQALSARHASGGTILFSGVGSITEYQYPLPGKAERALRETVKGLRIDVLSCIRWLNELPESPYSTSHVARVTGSAHGMPVGAHAMAMATLPPSRNEPCFCKSGKKFKRCHGSPTPS